jgi:hypothetical protein
MPSFVPKGAIPVSTITLFCGTLLIAVGALGYGLQDTDPRSRTALIPAGLGVVFIILGLLARKDSLRKHAMHFAALLGLLGFLMPAWRVIVGLGNEEVRPLARRTQMAMAAVCLVFLGLCINSFIQARRARAQRVKE